MSTLSVCWVPRPRVAMHHGLANIVLSSQHVYAELVEVLRRHQNPLLHPLLVVLLVLVVVVRSMMETKFWLVYSLYIAPTHYYVPRDLHAMHPVLL